jgi:two-component system, cell cycle sensor histidine kinase and response regulator CckA
MEVIIQILHLEDDPADAELIQTALAEAGLACRITSARTRDEFETALRDGRPDIILADYRLPTYDGMSALRLVRKQHPETPFIFVSGAMGEEAAIEALTQGATDYVLKQNLSRLATVVQRALQEALNLRDRKQAEEALQRSNMSNAARSHLMQFAATHSLDELLEEAVNEAEKVTESLIGFYHFVDDDQQSLTLQNWSTRTKAQFCKALGKGLHYPIADAGVWVDCVRQRKPVVHNHYMSLSHRKGLPEGHAEVVRELVVPVLRGEKIKAILGVGNKTADYTGKDVEAMSLMADLVWEITERKQTEQQLALMSFALDSIHETALLVDENARIQYVNKEACRTMGYSRDDLLTMTIPDINPNFSTKNWRPYWDDLKNDGTRMFEGQHKTKDGRLIPVEINTNYFEYEGRSYDLALIRDITEQKEAERQRLANLRFFESMDKVNLAIQGADDLEEMMKDLLDVVLSVFDCDRAFLMYPCDPESQTWYSPMERNKPEYPGVLDLKREIPMDPQVAETLRILLAADGPVTFGPGTSHALPEDVSEQFGFKCFMSMAIYPKTGSPWQFGIHQCAYARVWAAEEVRVFQAIGRRLADSLTSLLSYRDLRQNQEFLDNVVEHIPDMIFVKDAQTLKFLRFNRAGEQLLGYPREELLGKNDYDLFPKKEADFFTAKDRKVLDSRELVDIPEETIHTRSHEKRVLHTKKIPILDQTGAPQYLLGISEDITERKQTEESIRKLSQAVEQSPVAIVITNVAGEIEFVNAKFSQVSGYSYAEALGQPASILKSGETTSEEYSRLWETINSGGVWSGKFHNRKKNGELFWEHATIAPIRNENNLITHYLAVKEDITERKKIEEQLRQTQKMEAVGQLAGGVAHDFNNMLGAIIGYAELALLETSLDDTLRKNLGRILEAGHRSTEITRQLLAFARKQTIAPKILDLNETVEGMLKLLRRLIGEDIDLAWLPGAKLWPVNMDPSQLDQILANLCVNARDAIGGVGKVTIETHKVNFDDADCAEHEGFDPGGYVKLVVSDSGSGMDKATMDNIFEPFFTTKSLGKGTGLGLATVYGIVNQNKGIINVSSELGYGTTFRIYLPRHAAGTEHVREEVPVAPTALGDETILLVEDESVMLDMAKLMLEKFGYSVLAASTPGEAIRIARDYSGDIHLLITDVVMPEMNGRDLAKNIDSFFPGLSCLFMSGYTSDVITSQGVLDEGLNFIQKPFTRQSLAVKVREVLDGK